VAILRPSTLWTGEAMFALRHPVYSESGHDRYLQGIDMTTRESGKKTETESVGRSQLCGSP